MKDSLIRCCPPPRDLFPRIERGGPREARFWGLAGARLICKQKPADRPSAATAAERFPSNSQAGRRHSKQTRILEIFLCFVPPSPSSRSPSPQVHRVVLDSYLPPPSLVQPLPSIRPSIPCPSPSGQPFLSEPWFSQCFVFPCGCKQPPPVPDPTLPSPGDHTFLAPRLGLDKAWDWARPPPPPRTTGRPFRHSSDIPDPPRTLPSSRSPPVAPPHSPTQASFKGEPHYLRPPPKKCRCPPPKEPVPPPPTCWPELAPPPRSGPRLTCCGHPFFFKTTKNSRYLPPPSSVVWPILAPLKWPLGPGGDHPSGGAPPPQTDITDYAWLLVVFFIAS